MAMFGSFFYLLRARGLSVSTSEWLTLAEAMDKGLSGASLTRFYHLARSVLVKSEADYDKFDCAFLEFFRDITPDSDELPANILHGLNNPLISYLKDSPRTRRGGRPLPFNNQEIEQMYKDRLAKQKKQHNGGTNAIGTGGGSLFGNEGVAPKGKRAGGESRGRQAMAVAGERRYRDFRDDAPLDLRSFQLAFRRLRQYSNRLDVPADQLNIDDTIRATCDNCGRLELVYEKPRKNSVKLLLLMDSGGSMDMHARLCASLFQVVSKSNHFKDLKVYYFHNCFRDKLYKTPQIDYRDSVSTDWVMNNLDEEYKVIIVGDALMETGELVESKYSGGRQMASGLERLRAFKKRYRRLAWLTPAGGESLIGTYWGASYELINKEVDLQRLTVENLSKVVKKLMVAR